MKEQFKTWGWVKAYQVGERLYEKFSLEDSFPKDKPDDECIDELEERIERQARRKYPHLFQPFVYDSPINRILQDEYGQMPSGLTKVDFTTEGNLKFAKPKESKEQRIGVLVSDIQSCDELKLLETYHFIKETNPELKEAYDKKYAELKNL